MTERQAAPLSFSEQMQQAEERGRRMERVEIGHAVGIMDLSGFCYDPRNQEEILRLRDTISEAILKGRA